MRGPVASCVLNLALGLKIDIVVVKRFTTADALDEALTNVLCEDHKEYGIGKSLTGVSYAL